MKEITHIWRNKEKDEDLRMAADRMAVGKVLCIPIIYGLVGSYIYRVGLQNNEWASRVRS